MSTINKREKEECCPEFHPEKWNKKIVNWNHKKFIKVSVPTFFHIPFPPLIGKKITQMMKMAEDSRKLTDNNEDVLLLFSDPHPFKTEMYLSVTGDVSKANNIDISGTFVSKVFEDAYNAIPKFIKQMNVYLNKQEKKSQKLLCALCLLSKMCQKIWT